MNKFSYILIFMGIFSLNALSNTLQLPEPFLADFYVPEVSKPIIIRNETTGRWETEVKFDVREDVDYASAGVVTKITRATGTIKVEISLNEVLYLKGLNSDDKYSPGEWEQHLYEAMLTKAVILSKPSEMRTQYETYWDQVIYNPTPILKVSSDEENREILNWDGDIPIIGYNEDNSPIYGVVPKDANGNDILGIWNGLFVIDYDANGFPIFGE